MPDRWQIAGNVRDARTALNWLVPCYTVTRGSGTQAQCGDVIDVSGSAEMNMWTLKYILSTQQTQEHMAAIWNMETGTETIYKSFGIWM